MLLARWYNSRLCHFRLFFTVSQAHKSSHLLCLMGKHALQHSHGNIGVWHTRWAGFEFMSVSEFPDSDVGSHS